MDPTIDFKPSGSTYLTRGTAASVWLVNRPDQQNGKCIVKFVDLSVKILEENRKKNPETGEQMWEIFVSRFKSKVDQWKPLAHENVVRVLGIDEMLGPHVEYLAHGSAPEYLAEHPHDSIPLRKRMIGDVLAGLDYLHSQNPPLLHGGIRMDKLFVDARGTTKIGEFGLVSLVEGFEYCAPTIGHYGMFRWWCPELLVEEHTYARTTASDIWALGCTLFEIMSRKLPYHEYSHELGVFHKILCGETPGIPDDLLSPGFDRLESWAWLSPCWKWEPEQRPSIRQLREGYRIHLNSPPLESVA